MSRQLRIRSSLPMAAAAAIMLTACTEEAPLASALDVGGAAALRAEPAAYNTVIAELRRTTARYHNVDAALADGYIPVGECEVHEGEDPGGIPYANLDHLLDGAIDPSRPDALLYEPDTDGRLTLVGVELAVPYPMWMAADPPTLLGHTFRREDDMGVFGLHVWVWRHNPDGMFAWGNPRVACEPES